MNDMAAPIPNGYEQAEVVLARLLPRRPEQPSAPPFQRRRRVFPVYRSEARAAGGTTSDAFNAKIIRETVSACTTADDPDLAEAVAETVAGLRDIAPKNAREAMLAAQLIATHTAAMDSLAMARASSGLMSEAHLGHAARLAHAHAALSEALDRARRGDRQTVVFEYRHSP
jgi:hypothetical protein